MKVTFVECKHWASLDLANQGIVENAVKMLPGARIEFKNFRSWTTQMSESVLLFVMDFESATGEIAIVLEDMRKLKPFGVFFAVHFVILSKTAVFNPTELFEPSWIGLADKFADSAIIVNISMWFSEHPDVFRFQLTSHLSASFREIENLKESLRIRSVLSECEAKLTMLQQEFDRR
jgi:hypothetical protein